MPDLAEVRNAVEQIYGGKATLLHSVHVRDEIEGKVVWDSPVRVFEVRAGKPVLVYAGSLPVEGSAARRVFALRHTDKIMSPVAAVRTAIMMEHRRERPLL